MRGFLNDIMASVPTRKMSSQRIPMRAWRWVTHRKWFCRTTFSPWSFVSIGQGAYKHAISMSPQGGGVQSRRLPGSREALDSLSKQPLFLYASC
jgi:hypothetical protein